MPSRIFIIALLMASITSVHAIVIRHDTGYSRYVASESMFPAVFWLEQRSMRKVCVATLIDAQWALTAAHCVEETDLRAHIARAGEYAVQIAGVMSGIDKVVMHPNYAFRYQQDHASDEVDLALLHLREPLSMPVPMPLYREQDELDRVATLLGWGYFGVGLRVYRATMGVFVWPTIVSVRCRIDYVSISMTRACRTVEPSSSKVCQASAIVAAQRCCKRQMAGG